MFLLNYGTIMLLIMATKVLQISTIKAWTNYVTTLTSGSWLNVECKSTWGQENVFRSETHSHKWGENARDWTQWHPMTPKCTPILRVTFMQKSWIFKALAEKANKHQIRPLRYHWEGVIYIYIYIYI
jgi:hypothetical protein